ncbi:winged helix-turn-helix transcriptional regulator [Actinokineospora sp.]|uniref:winged helix-turn-helix transcriptional regulator n=1 Tax=Actinokineospora sp. TaxID=1872133 RepID=UPI004037C839
MADTNGKDSAGRDPDSVAAALSQVGDRWTFLLLREAFFGVHRFVDFQRNLGVARNLLSERLGQLTANGILERRLYQTRPERHEYRLTDKGRDLFGVTVAIMRWGDRWLSDTPPLLLTHAEDGGAVEQELRCADCGQVLTARDVRYAHTNPP